MLKEVAYYARMASRVAAWARQSPEPDPRAAVARNLENRETNFLGLIRRGVFENPANPYHQLFAWAGCEYGDLEQSVRVRGLEPALDALLHAGVFLTHDEFKGRTPVQRGGRTFDTNPAALANRNVPADLQTASSGSRGRAVVTGTSFSNRIYREAQERVLMAEIDAEGRESVFLSPILPALAGISRVIGAGHRDRSAGKWFAIGGDLSTAHYRAVTGFLMLELRLLGYPAVFPEYLPHNDFSPVARWIADRKRQGRSILVWSGVSHAVRVAAAAKENGLDISGARFVVGGEALTAAKLAVIESAGCDAVARYTISELGRVGIGCPRMHGNCVHVCRDSIAVITRRRVAPLTDTEVDSLMFTTVLPSASYVAVNLEMDDAGDLGPAACGCPLSDLGLTQQIDRIYSYGKLTGHGTTLLSGDLLHIVEHKLPARFGGVPGDYQLVEREGASQTEIELRVRPRSNAAPAHEIKSYFLAEIKGLWAGSMARWVWVQTEGVRVVFGEPYVSGARGKIHALHLLGSWNRVN